MNNKLNLLMVLENTGRGGSQAYVMNVIRNLDLNNYHVGVVVSRIIEGGYQDELKSLGCSIYILPYFKVFNYFQFVSAWRKLFKEYHYDIVHGHCTNSAGIYLRIAKKYGCKTIAHSHSSGYRGTRLERIVKFLFSKFAKSAADLWFSCSDKAALRLYGKSYQNSPNYYSMPNAICVRNYKFDANKRQHIRTTVNVSDNIKLYGHIGSFTTPKNHAFLIEIFNEISQIEDNARLMLCGAGPLLEDIKNKVKSLGLENKVIFTGLISNVADHFMAMDIMLFPSIFEGLPISIVEAQATGLPILHSDTITKEVDLTDLIETLSLNDSAKTWAYKAISMRKKDRKSQYKIISESIFNMEISIKQLDTLYKELVN